MSSYQKTIQIIQKRLKEKTPLIQFIIGPRQVGKTTSIEIIKKKFKDNAILYCNADGISTSVWIDENWQKAIFENKILVIDEIQKIQNWSEVVKRLWDQSAQRQRIKVVLLGSSSLQLQKGLDESLTGRFEVINAHHWNFADSKTIFKKLNLENYLRFGGYPGSYKFIKSEARWSQYLRSSIVETVIGKDILMQAKVKSPALFRQSFYIFANLPAQSMSYNKMLGQLQDKGNIDLIKYYLDLFEGAFFFKTISKFTNNEILKKQSSPKIISLAPSLNTFHRMDNLSSEYLGRVFESIVGAQLVRIFESVYYWAEGDYEVDFVIKYKNAIIAIEVKSGRNKKTKSLEKFRLKYPTSKVIFLTKENYIKFENDPVAFIEKMA